MLRAEAIDKYSIDLYWQVSCADEPIVIAYNITYRLLREENLDERDFDEMSEVIVDTENKLTHHRIEGLKSYRKYEVTLALLSAKRHGEPYGPIVARTLEDGNLCNKKVFY